MNIMPYENFKRYIDALRDKYERLDKISEVLKWDDAYELSMGDQVVELLTYIFNDEGDWINYWVYERDFGRDWYSGCATNKDGSNIDLSTTIRLYNFLIENMDKK